MKYTKTDVSLSPEILKRKLGAELLVPVTVADASFTNGECKAGTPLTAQGAKATTTEGVNNAYGILLSDVTDDNPNGSLIVAYATVNETVAQAHSGVTYDSALKTALSNITFEAQEETR